MELIKSEYGLNTMQLIDLLILIMVSSGVCGFIYELFFYKIDTGKFVKRGSSYGPWIPIYAFGGLAYALLVYRFKDKRTPQDGFSTISATQDCGITTQRYGISEILEGMSASGRSLSLALQG